jgi:hypothetical protein
MRPLAPTVVAIVCLFWAGCVTASMRKLPNIDSAFYKADVVILLRVKSVDNRFIGKLECGTRYRGAVIQLFKSDTNRKLKLGEIFTFGRSEGLSVGHEYLLFLTRVSDAAREVERVESEIGFTPPVARGPSLSTQEKLAIATCSGLIPGYRFDNDMAWPIEYGGVTVFGLFPKSAIPSSIRVEYQNGPQRVLRAADVFRHFTYLSKQRPAQTLIK